MICFCIAIIFALSLISCSNEKAEDGKIAVVRVSEAMQKGEQISEDKVYIDYVREEIVPVNALRTLEDVVGKYLTEDVVAHDYLFRSRVKDAYIVETDAPNTKAYVSVKENISAGADNTEEIQKLINENPNRTLYFADGTYTVSKPLVIFADSDRKVSFELADYAVIKAADTWSEDGAVVSIVGGGDEIASVGILGGTIDGSGKARGIDVLGGRDNTIMSVTVKNATVGISLGDKSERTVIENTDIVGNGEGSVGIEIIGDGNQLDIVQIDNCLNGVVVEGCNNDLRNVHAAYMGGSLESRGYIDGASGNHYDFCYAENFSIGFFMKASASASEYGSCFVFWNNGIAIQTGFASEGKFNSLIRTSRVNFECPEAISAYITVGAEGGVGRVLWPIVKNSVNIDDDTYKAYLGDTELTEDLT